MTYSLVMKNSKYKILVVPSDRTGVSKFRSVDPHLNLQKMYPDEFWVDIDYNPKLEDDEFLKQYDLIHYHRSLGPDFSRSSRVVERLKQLGIPSIMDLDDYWLPTIDHPAHAIVKQNKLDELIKNSVKEAQNVTTTTTIFADEISKLKNIKKLSLSGNQISVIPKTIAELKKNLDDLP